MPDSEVNMKKVKLLMVQRQEIEDGKNENVLQLEYAAGQAAVDVGSHKKEVNGDGSGSVLHRIQGDTLWVTDLSQHEVASDSAMS